MKASKTDHEVTDRAIRKFNPGLLQSDEEVTRQFVVRHHELEVIREVLTNNIGTPSCQQLLVIAPRGQGKTMLLERVGAEIRRDSNLGRHLLPVRFMEETQEVFGIAEFWLETLFHLAREIAAEHTALAKELTRTHAELSKRWREQTVGRLAQTAVLDTADRLGRRLVLIVENIQSLISTVDEQFGWELRGALQSYPQIMLVASATTRFEKLRDPQQPFFELFRLVPLKPLSTHECVHLWTEVSGQARCSHEIRPLKILTGGNPRLLVLVATFARHRSLRQLMEDLAVLVDENTDYFRGHLESLPKHERRVFVSLIDLWQASSAGEIATRSRLDIRIVSTMLGRLVTRGAVTVVSSSKGTKRLYAATEGIYSIYYKLRRERNEAAVVEALIHFMVAFYDEKAVTALSKQLIRDALESTAIRSGIESALEQRDFNPDPLTQLKWDEFDRTLEKIKDIQPTYEVVRLQRQLQNAYGNRDHRRIVELLKQNERCDWVDSLTDIEWTHLSHVKSDAYLSLDKFSNVIAISDEVAERLGGTHDITLLDKMCSMKLSKALAHYELGQFEKSKFECERLIEHFGNYVLPSDDARFAAALVLQAKSESELGHARRAVILLDEVLERFGQSDAKKLQLLIAESLVLKGEIARTRGDDQRLSAEIFGEVVTRFRGSEDAVISEIVTSAWLNQGFMYGLLGDFTSEIVCYTGLTDWIKERGTLLGNERSLLVAFTFLSRRMAELGYVAETLEIVDHAAALLEISTDRFDQKIRSWIDWHLKATRALALMASGESSAAMKAFLLAYDVFQPDLNVAVAEMLRLVAELIASGASERDLIGVLQSNSSRAQKLQPVIVALKMRLGDAVRAPTEVLEVAADLDECVQRRITEGVAPGFTLQTKEWPSD